MIAAGVDVGSVGSKAAIFNGKMLGYAIVPTGWSPQEAGKAALKLAAEKARIELCSIKYIVGTGYGRNVLDFAQTSITEITCHAKGIRHIFPEARTIIDIGGQDSKVIRLAKNGQVADFLMNDKCAAGTGRFLQTLSTVLGIDVAGLADLAKDKTLLPINSMCTVFAESEVISLLAQGVDKGQIAAGLLQSICLRTASMVNRIGIEPQVVFTGGTARNTELAKLLAKELQQKLLVPEMPQITGALGAAVIGYEKL